VFQSRISAFTACFPREEEGLGGEEEGLVVDADLMEVRLDLNVT
jgi:hypothetical protein